MTDASAVKLFVKGPKCESAILEEIDENGKAFYMTIDCISYKNDASNIMNKLTCVNMEDFHM